MATMRNVIPLRERPWDIGLLVFFFVNLTFITYIVDFEQIMVADPANFAYPIWPPAALIDLVHWWGRTFDPVLLARPPWWMATIWIDALFFGPYYAVAIFAFWKGREWIRIPTIVYASVIMTNVVIILSEEIWGAHASPELPIVLLANAPWLLVPLFLLFRMALRPHPFTRPVLAGERP